MTTTTNELERSLLDMNMTRQDTIRPQEPSSTVKELNEVLLHTIVDHWENRHYDSDYSSFMREYLQHAESLSHTRGTLPNDLEN